MHTWMQAGIHAYRHTYVLVEFLTSVAADPRQSGLLLHQQDDPRCNVRTYRLIKTEIKDFLVMHVKIYDYFTENKDQDPIMRTSVWLSPPLLSTDLLDCSGIKGPEAAFCTSLEAADSMFFFSSCRF